MDMEDVMNSSDTVDSTVWPSLYEAAKDALQCLCGVDGMKAKLLPQSDVDEIVRFQQYLADQQTMPRDEFYRKYQEYMGLSDAELEKALS